MEKLYKLDTKGKIRVWWIEYDDEKYCVHSGLNDGKIVVSGWKYPVEKNVGKANHTLIEDQVKSEVAALYKKQIEQGGYHTSIDEVENGKSYFAPMLAERFDKIPLTYPIYSQPKLDGMRAVIKADGVWSRNGKRIFTAPHIFNQLGEFFKKHPNVVLDGELYNHELKSEFEKLMSLIRKTKPTPEDLGEAADKVEFHCYDVYIGDKPNKPFSDRYEWLTNNVHHMFDKVEVVKTIQINSRTEAENQLSIYLANVYEGQILRVIDSVYENKRSRSLIKHKTFEDAEFEIVDILEGVGNWAGYAKTVVIRLEDGTIQQSGMRGNQAFAAELLKNKADYIGTDVTISFAPERTSDGKLRFPVAIKFWKGKRDL